MKWKSRHMWNMYLKGREIFMNWKYINIVEIDITMNKPALILYYYTRSENNNNNDNSHQTFLELHSTHFFSNVIWFHTIAACKWRVTGYFGRASHTGTRPDHCHQEPVPLYIRHGHGTWRPDNHYPAVTFPWYVIDKKWFSVFFKQGVIGSFKDREIQGYEMEI